MQAEAAEQAEAAKATLALKHQAAEEAEKKALLERLEQNPNVQRIAADREAEMPAFLAMIAAKK